MKHTALSVLALALGVAGTVGLFVSLVWSSPVFAQAPPRKEARELAGLIFTPGMFDEVSRQAAKAATSTVAARSQGKLQRQLSAMERTKLQVVIERAFKESIPASAWRDLHAGVLSKHLSRDDLLELLVFYRTPLGAKALRMSSVMISAGASAGEQLAKSHEKEFGERFVEGFTKELPELAAEIARK